MLSVDATPIRPEPSPENDDAVIIPLAASIVIPVPTLTTLLNVAAVPVIMLSVDAIPINQNRHQQMIVQ